MIFQNNYIRDVLVKHSLDIFSQMYVVIRSYGFTCALVIQLRACSQQYFFWPISQQYLTTSLLIHHKVFASNASTLICCSATSHKDKLIIGLQYIENTSIHGLHYLGEYYC